MTTILPTFELDELLLGKFLGHGGFCKVHEIQDFSLHKINNNNDDETNEGVDIQHQSRVFIARHCLRRNESSAGEAVPRYAIKRPRHDRSKDCSNKQPQDDDDDVELYRKRAIQDLVLETYFLRQLEHPHIIKLRGVSVDVASTAAAVSSNDNDDRALRRLPLTSLEVPCSSSYFLVLDRLYDTLHTRIRKQWKPRLGQEYKKHINAIRRQQFKSLFSFQRQRGSIDNVENEVSMTRSDAAFLRQRLQIALDLSAALEYLHNCKHPIWHRDLKPDNIGFDIRGHVKIFDFGLAKRQPRNRNPSTLTNSCSSEVLFLATQMTGTLRYMAPEVGMGHHYNAKCDSYSFAHVLWEMLTCQKPYLEFQDLSHQKDVYKAFKKSVWIGNTRPPLVPPQQSSPPPSSSFSTKPVLKWTPLTLPTVDILQGGWHVDVKQRWTMSSIKSKLQEEVLRLKQMENKGTGRSHANTPRADAAASPEKKSCTIPTYNCRRSTSVFCHHSKIKNDGNNHRNKTNERTGHMNEKASTRRTLFDDEETSTSTVEC